MKRLTLLFAVLLLAPAAALFAGDETLPTAISLLIGHPADGGEGPTGVLVVPGTVIPVASEAVKAELPGKAGEGLVEVAESLQKSLRLSKVDVRYHRVFAFEVGVTKDLPRPAKTSDVNVSVRLLGFNDSLATYEVRFYDGSTVIADSPLTVRRGERAVVGGLDGDEAPYLFLVVEPRTVEGSGTVHLVGGEVTEPVRLRATPPTYPPEAREKKIEGAVVLKVTIEADGTISNVEVLWGEPAFVDSAVEAIRQWTFEPARLNGKPVAVYYNLTVNYRFGDKDDPQ